MSLTILLDLDDTLLDTNVDIFLPAYFKALGEHLRPVVSPDVMLPALMSGTQRMLENTDPSRTLQEVFEQHFYPSVGGDREKLRVAIEDFYERAFSALGSVTSPRPGARELVDWALVRGYRLAVATDPLFPRQAIFERLRWAGLDPARFELISSFETFHFTKSHSAYYAEMLGRLGWPDGPILMAGNDEDRDLKRAQEFGLMTYQVDGASAPVAVQARPTHGDSSMTRRGTLKDLRAWLETVDPDMLEPSFQRWQSILTILRSTPAVLQSLARGLSPEAWKHEPTPDDWALIEIICHLRDTEREVHHAQLHTLMNDPQPFVPRPDAAVWAKQRNYLDEDGPRAIADFTAARLETLDILQQVSPEIRTRSARHAIFGPTHFTEVVGFMADHDRLHIQQAWQTLKAPGK